MKEDKNFMPDSNGSNEEDFQKFLEMIKSGDFNFPEYEEGEEVVDEEYPDLLEDVDDPFSENGDMCPALSTVMDIVKESVSNIGVLGIRWSEDDMIDVLKAFGYKPSIFTIDIELPDDLNDEERELMQVIIPNSKVEVKIVKKGRVAITKDNFNDYRPKEVFNREISKFGKKLLIKLISEYGKGEKGA